VHALPSVPDRELPAVRIRREPTRAPLCVHDLAGARGPWIGMDELAWPGETCRPSVPRHPHVAQTGARRGHVISNARGHPGLVILTLATAAREANCTWSSFRAGFSSSRGLLGGVEMSTGVRPWRRFTMGRREDATHPDTIRAAISEFLATAIFVFAAEGSVLSLGTYPTLHCCDSTCTYGCLRADRR
jgi:hypothetical protein